MIVGPLIAVLTCPRPGGVRYIDQSLPVLARSGKPLCVFNDRQCRGSRWNGWQAIAFAAARGVERLLLVEDDVVAEEGFVDGALTLPIPPDVGIVNFHDFGDDFFYEPPPPGHHRFAAHRFGSIGMKGSQCLLIPGDHVAWLAAQDRRIPQEGDHALDFALGWWTARSARPNKLIVVPSPVRHIGEVSACHELERRAGGLGIPHAPAPKAS